MSEQEESKKWYLSKGVMGGIMSVFALTAGAFGYVISPEEQEVLVLVITGLASGILSLVGSLGRIKATKKIG